LPIDSLDCCARMGSNTQIAKHRKAMRGRSRPHRADQRTRPGLHPGCEPGAAPRPKIAPELRNERAARPISSRRRPTVSGGAPLLDGD
jgi:hypothetical protein